MSTRRSECDCANGVCLREEKKKVRQPAPITKGNADIDENEDDSREMESTRRIVLTEVRVDPERRND